MFSLVKDGLRSVSRAYRLKKEQREFPYLKVNELPANRPSIESIYYYLNQLGKHLPEGLTHNQSVGYHELPFPELKFKVSRSDLDVRIRRILSALDVQGKVGVDFGCAIGGITFALQKHGATMVGIDRDIASLNVAKECESYFKTGAKFVQGLISEDVCRQIVKTHFNPNTGRWDFAVWFSSFNWVAKALGKEKAQSLLHYVSTICDTLVMDSAIGGKAHASMCEMGISDNESFKKFVIDSTEYTKSRVIGVDENWYGREVVAFTK